MYFTIEQKELVTALESVKFAVSTRSTLPILGNVKITARDEFVVDFEATNLEAHARYVALAKGSVGGSVTVDHKELLALVKPLKGETLTFWLDENRLEVKSSTMTIALPTMDVEEFPQGPLDSIRTVGSTWVSTQTVGKRPLICKVTRHDCEVLTLPVQDFHRALSLVGYGAATDDSRPVLTGLYMEYKNGRLRLVTADAFRLCLKDVTVEGGWSEPALPSARTVMDAFKKFPKRGDLIISVESVNLEYQDGTTVTTGHQGPYIFFRSGPMEVAMRLIDGAFPNYRAIIPHGYATEAKLPAATFQRALNSVKTIVADSSNITGLHVNGGITVKAQRDGMEQPMLVELEATTDGPELEAKFNWTYLSQVVATSPKSQVILRATSPIKPATLSLSEEPDFLAVVMPMQPHR